MNTKAKQYAMQCLEKKINADNLGFLLIENFERKPFGKWPFLGGEVFVAEFDRAKGKVEKIHGEILKGETNLERVKRFVNSQNPNSKIYSAYQLLWNCEQLSQRLLLDEQSPEVFDICKGLSKQSFTSTELKEICKSINDFNKRIYQEANERATSIARAN